MLSDKDHRKKQARPAGLVRRLRRLVIETDWDGDFMRYERWVDLFSWSIVVFSVLFFLPVTLSILSR